MASLSRVNVQVGFNGSQAESGFKKLSKEAEDFEKTALMKRLEGMNALERQETLNQEKIKNRRMNMTVAQIQRDMDLEEKALKKKQKADEWRKMSAFEKLATVTKGAADVSAAANGLVGLANKAASTVSSFVRLGSEYQTSQIKLAYLTGSWDEAGQVLENIRQQSMETGQSFAGMVDGLQKLTSVGLSAGAAATVLERMGNAAELLGAQGMSSLAGSINQLMRAGTATEGALMSLQDQGLDVFGALGDSLSKVTGKAYTTEEAIRAIRRGAVSSAQAIEAIDAASNSPKAREAAQRFFGSFEGQVARLKTTMEDTFREISKLFLEAFDWTAVAAGLRGSFSAIRDIAKEISDLFLPVVDPKNKAEGIEKSFRFFRDVTFEFSERLAKAMISLSEALSLIMIRVDTTIQKAMNVVEGGVAGWAMGDTQEKNKVVDNWAKRDIDNAAMKAFNDKMDVEDFFEGLRKKAAARDADQAKKLGMGNLFGGAFDTIRDGAKALADQVKQAAAKMQMAKLTFEKTALDLEENFATPAEQFQKAMADVGNQLKDARGRLAKGDPLLGRVEAGLQRKAGKQIMDFLKENEVGTSWQASRADKGSAAAMEAILRNRFGEQGKDVQQRIKGALDLANRLAQQQLAAQERAIAAFENARPGVVAFK